MDKEFDPELKKKLEKGQTFGLSIRGSEPLMIRNSEEALLTDEELESKRKNVNKLKTLDALTGGTLSKCLNQAFNSSRKPFQYRADYKRKLENVENMSETRIKNRIKARINQLKQKLKKEELTDEEDLWLSCHDFKYFSTHSTNPVLFLQKKEKFVSEINLPSQ
jgi:hypothetical protein